MAFEINEDLIKGNVFCETLKIPVTKVYDFKRFKAGSDGLVMPDSYCIERQASTRIYHTKGSKEMVNSFSAAALCLYGYIVNNLELNKDYIVIDRKAYMRWAGISSINTVKKAITELWQCNFIAPVPAYPKLVYFVNPKYVFNGNRLAKFPNNLDVRGEMSKREL
jgi:hypothetical protein